MSHMQISDEKLSAFLDGELSPEEMLEVREAIAADAALVTRLAEIKQTDALVIQHAHAMDSKPMPEAIVRRLQEPEDKVVSLNVWRRGQQVLEQHAALAAGIVMAVALVVFMVPGQLEQEGATLANYEDYLAATPSGNTVMVDDETVLTGRFSFRDKQSRYCRQYHLQTQEMSSENVACRNAQGWALVASLETRIANGDEYRPSSQASTLETLVDDIIEGDTLTIEEEQALIDQGWYPEQ